MVKKTSINQAKAIRHGDGPCIVLSGPGSGKTFVLTNRILNLICEYGISPDNILIITFTRASANEMKYRFISLLKEKNIELYDMPSFGTFHSIFFEILKNDFGYNNNSLLTDVDEKKYLSEVIEKEKNKNITSDTLLNIIRDIRNYKLYNEREEEFLPKYLSKNEFQKIYNSYQEKLFYNKKLDFSDMIIKCYELLSIHNDILTYYQNKYKYILIDEFQDINKSQYDLVKMICRDNNLFVVGDDDQSIYKFRGSNPRVMSNFLKDYKNAKKIYLTENYRCARKIVKFSRLVIENNKDRFVKDLKAVRDDVGMLQIKAFVDSIEENEYIINQIKTYNRKGIDYKDMAILYRTNLLSNSIKSNLIKNNISFNIKGIEKSIYENFAVKDIIAYMMYSLKGDDSKSLMLVANKPNRYISRDSIKYEGTTIDDLIRYYRNIDYVLKNLYKLKYDLNKIKNSIPALAIRYIRYNMTYDKYLMEYCRLNDIDYEDEQDILDEFEEEAIRYKSLGEILDYIENSKKIIKNTTDNDDAINLMTFHLSKGLEYKIVFIIDTNDGLIPHKKSIRENDIETERRLFYVAMTRAKDNLHIFFTTRRFGKTFKASRFIVEAIGGQNGKKV